MQFKRISPEVRPLVQKVETPAPVRAEVRTETATPFTTPSTAPTSPYAKGDGVLLYNDSESGVGYKQWGITRLGTTVTTSWGHVGSVIRTTTKVFKTVRLAENAMDDLIRTKRRKGYRDKP